MTDYTDEIKARLEKATPGPWRIEETETGYNIPGILRSVCSYDEDGNPESHAFLYGNNAEFIAHAPTDIANLLKEREVLREALFNLSREHYSCIKDVRDPWLNRANEALAWKPKEEK